jgi:hypothetical protein
MGEPHGLAAVPFTLCRAVQRESYMAAVSTSNRLVSAVRALVGVLRS